MMLLDRSALINAIGAGAIIFSTIRQTVVAGAAPFGNTPFQGLNAHGCVVIRLAGFRVYSRLTTSSFANALCKGDLRCFSAVGAGKLFRSSAGGFAWLRHRSKTLLLVSCPVSAVKLAYYGRRQSVQLIIRPTFVLRRRSSICHEIMRDIGTP
jgi:hypothetical protein